MAEDTPATNMVAQVRRMRTEAAIRMADSADLSSRAARQSDSAYLLELLAFEILLKALYRIHVGDPGSNHKYDELYENIPVTVRGQVEAAARHARPTGAYVELTDLLKCLGRNFVALRYPYEKYFEMSEAEYLARGDEWIARGALSEEADYVYYSVELNGLTQGLLGQIDAWLTAAP